MIANRIAYRYVLLDFELWRDLSLDLQKLFFTQIYDFIVCSSQSSFNVNRLLKLCKIFLFPFLSVFLKLNFLVCFFFKTSFADSCHCYARRFSTRSFSTNV